MRIPNGVECLALTALKPDPRNARTHSPSQLRQIAASIEKFGFTNPVLIDENLQILAGHGRVGAAKLLGIDVVPVVRIEHMSEAEKRAYIIADNQLALKAGWDEEILATELQVLGELEFDLELTGFDMGEIDGLIGDLELVDQCDEVEIPKLCDGPTITQLGDIWQVGDHRLICGDASEARSSHRLLDGEKAELIFTDPPYNVPINGHVSGLGKWTHSEFTMATGEMSAAEFEAFLAKTFGHLAAHSKPGSIHFVCMDWRQMGEVLKAGASAYTELKNLCVWTKSNGGMGSLYRSQHELVFVFKAGTEKHVNNVELGKHGRNRTNVWAYAGANSFSDTRDEDLAMHPTVKPLELVKDAILDCSKRGGVVLDAFGGSGTTLLAAEKTGRRGYGVELDPAYCDVILKRLVGDGLYPVRVDTGERFADLLNPEREVENV